MAGMEFSQDHYLPLIGHGGWEAESDLRMLGRMLVAFHFLVDICWDKNPIIVDPFRNTPRNTPILMTVTRRMA